MNDMKKRNKKRKKGGGGGGGADKELFTMQADDMGKHAHALWVCMQVQSCPCAAFAKIKEIQIACLCQCNCAFLHAIVTFAHLPF